MEKMMKRIQTAPVARDVNGEWHHPDLPAFDEGDAAKFQAWLDEQGLQPMRIYMEFDAEALHDRYCDGIKAATYLMVAVLGWAEANPARKTIRVIRRRRTPMREPAYG